jgi:NAD(P)-dependent dehydrogenase (short-subunit alcohol dehydrogenase family)
MILSFNVCPQTAMSFGTKLCPIHEGGIAYAAQVDALDEQAVQAYLDRIAQETGSIDILLNVMGPQPKDFGNGTSTLELPLEHFLLPLSTLVPSQFITARAAARHMARQRFSGASQPLVTRHGWPLFSPPMGREPSPARW